MPRVSRNMSRKNNSKKNNSKRYSRKNNKSSRKQRRSRKNNKYSRKVLKSRIRALKQKGGAGKKDNYPDIQSLGLNKYSHIYVDDAKKKLLQDPGFYIRKSTVPPDYTIVFRAIDGGTPKATHVTPVDSGKVQMLINIGAKENIKKIESELKKYKILSNEIKLSYPGDTDPILTKLIGEGVIITEEGDTYAVKVNFDTFDDLIDSLIKDAAGFPSKTTTMPPVKAEVNV